MGQIVIDINDAALPRVRDALCAYGDFDTNSGGLTKAQFAKKTLAQWVKQVTKSYEGRNADRSASDTAESEIVVS